MKGLFPVRSCRRRGRTRPQGGSLNVPRPDASKTAGTHSGSHPEGRSTAEDGSAVDIASMLAGYGGKGGEMDSRVSLTHLDGQTCCTGAYRASYSAFDFKMDPWAILMREPHLRWRRAYRSGKHSGPWHRG